MRQKLIEVLNEAKQLYQHALKDNAVVYQSLISRGLTEKTIHQFEIGYSDAFCLKQLKINQEALKKVGLLNEKGFERNWNRIMFPIQDINGTIVGFNGRTQKEKDSVKYLLSPESLIFSKSKTLYNLHRAKDAIKKEDRVYIVEGVFDVMAMWQAGIENVVSGLGTSLSLEQIDQLKPYTQNVTFGYDDDFAGFKSSVINAIHLSQHIRKQDEQYNPKQRITFLMFHEECDPADYLLYPNRLRELTDNPCDYLSYCRTKCELNPDYLVTFEQIEGQKRIKQERGQVKVTDHDSILANLNIVEIIGYYVQLKKAGRNYKGICPFHEEKTPSFVVSPEKKIFKCFGCGEGGNVIEFLARKEKKSYIDTLREIKRPLG